MSNDDLVTRPVTFPMRLEADADSVWHWPSLEADFREAAARITELEAELDAAEIERGKARRIILNLRAENARLREAGNQLAAALQQADELGWDAYPWDYEKNLPAGPFTWELAKVALAAWAALSGEPT